MAARQLLFKPAASLKFNEFYAVGGHKRERGNRDETVKVKSIGFYLIQIKRT
jgi:hypothetical protein